MCRQLAQTQTPAHTTMHERSVEIMLIGVVRGVRPRSTGSLLNRGQLIDTIISVSSLAFLVMKLECHESKALKIVFQLIRSP